MIMRAVLGGLLGHLGGPSWVVSGPSGRLLWLPWGDLGGLLGRLGASGSREETRTPNSFNQIRE
eukprot:1874716-Pyramimonas_sp.AAC.1